MIPVIDIEISGQLPQLNDNLEPAMEEAAGIMYRSVLQNFLEGGRPNPWEPLKSTGEASHLMQSRRLFKDVQTEYDKYSAEVFVDTDRNRYAMIHDVGGETHPTVTPQSKKFFWAMFEETGDDKWKWMALMPEGSKLNVNIPARPFMLFQEEDKERILEIIENAILTQTERK